MSENVGEIPESERDAYINTNEIDEVANDDGVEPMSEDEGGDEDIQDDEDDEEIQRGPGDEDDEQIEIDMSNNSSGYFDSHQESVYLVASHPTLPMVVSGGGDNLGYLWTTNSNPPKLVAQLTGHTESLITGGFTFDGSYLVTGDMTGQIRIWKSTMRGQRWSFEASVQEVEEIVWIRFHPKQNIFAVGASDGSVWCYALEPKLENLAVLSSHSMATTSGLFVNTDDMDSLTLVTISEDATIVNWNVYSSAANYTLTRRELKGEHPWVSITASPSGRTVAVGAVDGTIAIIGLENGNLLHSIATLDDSVEVEDKSVEGLVWSETANILAAGNVRGDIFLYDVATWRLRKALKVGDSVTALEFIKGTPILVSADMEGAVCKWDVRSGEQKWVGLGHSEGILGFTIQQNGTRIITAGDEGICLVFNDEPNQLVVAGRS